MMSHSSTLIMWCFWSPQCCICVRPFSIRGGRTETIRSDVCTHHHGDFFSGDDLSGLPVSFAGDEVFEEEIHKDLEMAREAGIPLYHAIYRNGIVRQTEPPMKRMYFRLLQRLKRRDGGFEIFWVTIRKNLQSNVDLFSDLLGGRPDEV